MTFRKPPDKLMDHHIKIPSMMCINLSGSGKCSKNLAEKCNTVFPLIRSAGIIIFHNIQMRVLLEKASNHQNCGIISIAGRGSHHLGMN